MDFGEQWVLDGLVEIGNLNLGWVDLFVGCVGNYNGNVLLLVESNYCCFDMYLVNGINDDGKIMVKY